jgi:hypothetical protein
MAVYLKQFSTHQEYDAYINGSGAILPNVSICTTEGDVHYNPSSPVPPTPSHDYVEIGGVKWATMNVGANSVTDTGLYFQWGDISGYTASQVGSGEGQKYFGWADYKYSNNGGSGATDMTKYNSTDGKTVLEASDDAATVNWGGSWRMPTDADFKALSAATTSAWTTNYQGSGVAGIQFTDKTDSSKTLFFPAAGYYLHGSPYYAGSRGYYWSSLLYTDGMSSGHQFFFYSGMCNILYDLRCSGLPVRGVLADS